MVREAGGEAIPEDLRSEIIREIPPLERLISRIRFAQRIDRLLDHAGLQTTLTHFVLFLSAGAAVGFAAIFGITGNFRLGFLAACSLILISIFYLLYLKNKRIDKFTEQLPEALAMISRSLRAGHALPSAIELVGQEMAEPSKDLFRTACEQQKLGLRITDSLSYMTERIESLDLRFFLTAVTINSEVGGNLAEILDKLGDTIRERLKIKRQIRVYTAQGRMSGYVLGALPIITFFIFHSMMPSYEDVLLKEKAGNHLLIIAGLAQMAGFFVIRKIIDIRT